MSEISTFSTDEAKQKFLKSFARYGNVSKAARAARIDRTTVYVWKGNDEVFAKALESAKEDASDALEAEAFRRAVTGVTRDIHYQGVKIGTEKQYSDSLLTLLLKANNPAKFKDRTDITSGDQPLKAYVGINPDDV